MQNSETYLHKSFALLNLDVTASVLFPQSVWPCSGTHQISYLVGTGESLPTDKASGGGGLAVDTLSTILTLFDARSLASSPPCIRKLKHKNAFNSAPHAVSNFNN